MQPGAGKLCITDSRLHHLIRTPPLPLLAQGELDAHFSTLLDDYLLLGSFSTTFFASSSSPMFANVQRQSRLGAPRLAPCRAHHHQQHQHPKRLESDEPPAKCARLSESPPDAGLLPSPGSPFPPALPNASPLHQGPSCIGSYLLLPGGDRENVSRALHLHTGCQLQCKIFSLSDYQHKIHPYIHLPWHRDITGIVEVIQGESKAYVFFEQEYGDMHSYVRSCKRLSEEQAAKLFRQIIRAVSHCHSSNIVLGDLKLRKFVFSDQERTQLRLESLEDAHIMKGADDALSDKHGCPAYVSPEILNTTGTYSGKSADVWSLGVMLFTLLVGRYPFHDSDPSSLFSKIRRGQYCIPDHVTPKARCLIRSLLRREPSERLTADEILLHPWFQAASNPSLADQEPSNTDQMVPDVPQTCDDLDSFFC